MGVLDEILGEIAGAAIELGAELVEQKRNSVDNHDALDEEAAATADGIPLNEDLSESENMTEHVDAEQPAVTHNSSKPKNMIKFDLASARNGFIYSEIFGPPVSKRGHRR